MTPPTCYQAVIIGSGFSGICNAVKLLESGIRNICVLEKAGEVGGTWRENTYPGAACDVQSHLYSFSFAGNSDWSHVFSPWHEILDYIKSVRDKYALESYIKYDQKLVQAEFNEQQGFWALTMADGSVLHSQSLIMGTGPLHIPSIPNIPGLENFKGKVFHSAKWDHEVDFSGKKVVSIGTGGSAIQYVPEVAKTAETLTVFQRTPAWVLPRNERAYSKLEKKLFKVVPGWRRLYRTLLYWKNEARVFPMHYPILIKLGELGARLHLRMGVKDPEVRKKLTPDYTIGCKRILISNQYYPAFNRDNVELNTDGIKNISETSVIDSNGTAHEADIIILGTGFVADPSVYMKDLPIIGLGGKRLSDVWQDGAESFYGLSVSGFPNFFQMTGPNTGLGHNSMVFIIEAQSRYVVDAVKKLEINNAKYMDLRLDKQNSFNQKIQRQLKGTVWQTGCSSWYKREDGQNFTIWPNTTFRYYFETKKINDKNYQWTVRG